MFRIMNILKWQSGAIGAVRPAALAWVLPKIMPQLEKITVSDGDK